MLIEHRIKNINTCSSKPGNNILLELNEVVKYDLTT